MEICGIIFDKDGTLLDFDKFWVSITYKAVDEILKKCGADKSLKPKILQSLGVFCGETDITGQLCSGTYESMTECIFKILSENGADNLSLTELKSITVGAYHHNLNAGTVAPACGGLCEILKNLKEKGIFLALVTTDDAYFTERCLKMLGIHEFFDEIYTDDGIFPTKPNPFCIEKFCNDFNLSRENVIMVGDTLTDTAFAKNGGIFCVGVAKSERSKNVLKNSADVVIDDVSHIFEVFDYSLSAETVGV